MTTTASPAVPAGDDDIRAADQLDVAEQLALVRTCLEGSTSARAMFAAEVVEDAIAEITYLRGCFCAVQRGARPVSNFWDGLRKRKRS